MDFDLERLNRHISQELVQLEKQPSSTSSNLQELGFMKQFDLVRKLTQKVALVHIQKKILQTHEIRKFEAQRLKEFMLEWGVNVNKKGEKVREPCQFFYN